MKKFIAAVLAAATALTMGATVFAEAEKTNDIATTMTFDTDKALGYVHTYGNAADAGLTLTLTDKDALAGQSLKLYESFDEALSSRHGGIYFEAADFGLESFAGHTLSFHIKVSKAAADEVELLDLFADGAKYTSRVIDTSNPNAWNKVEITIPSEVANTKVGVAIPIIEPFEGEIAMIDDVVIKDYYGKTVVNIGDIDTSLYEAPNGVLSVLSIILFVILILAVIAGVAYFIIKVKRTYR